MFTKQFSRLIGSDPGSQYIKVDLELTLKKNKLAKLLW